MIIRLCLLIDDMLRSAEEISRLRDSVLAAGIALIYLVSHHILSLSRMFIFTQLNCSVVPDTRDVIFNIELDI